MLPVAPSPSRDRRCVWTVAVIEVAIIFLWASFLGGSFGTAYASSASERKQAAPTPAVPAAKAVKDQAPGVQPVATPPAPAESSPEGLKEAQLLFRKREKELEEREKDLERREQVLQRMMADIEARAKELEETRVKMEADLAEKKKKMEEGMAKDLAKLKTGLDDKKKAEVDAAAEVFRVLEPKIAARYFAEMETSKVLEVLKLLPPTKSGAILAAMEADIQQMTDKPGGTEPAQESEKARRLKRLKEIGDYLVHPPDEEKP